ncbi:PQQ-binding-like beta-propeller repeat protein [Streptomyces sp. SID5785]|uniref:serine/threonine-protein kinase n=1 Tax=Streptomyces sp. SID5785 TaxID=2690309 RepID=UPI001361E89E|nr:serine/threonine-protein kinase [Streptomyces sp. SID5785]MZD03860.1 PQQ-binding-like beta-propeller repeat protein [Streptomyces sp. SID5785]
MPLREDDPESVGGYRIESRIGTGGMGVVYRARTSSGRAVAVKVVHAQYADDPEFRARFRQEVRAARRVSGAFTAPVVDADPEAELPWMATVYVAGDTLAQRVAEQGVLDRPQLRRLGVELAEALREIHRAEVVHRDLKPSNVLLLGSGKDDEGGSDPDGSDGAVRVIDFGISRAAQSDVRTQTGMVLGSPPFMAPEQFSSPRDVGPPVDVFSFGALLVYAATGRSPFEAENAYLAAYQTVHHEPELGALPAELRPLVLACLAKAPQDRPTPDALRDALAAMPEGDPGDGPAVQGASGGPTLALTVDTGAGTGTGTGAGTGAGSQGVTPLASPASARPADSADATPVTPPQDDGRGPGDADGTPRLAGGASGAAGTTLAGGGAAVGATPPRASRRRRITVAASALAVVLVAAAGISVALHDGAGGEDTAARQEAPSAGTPAGWRAWHTSLTEKPEAGKNGGDGGDSGDSGDGSDMMGSLPDSYSCTPSPEGVYCSSFTTTLIRVEPLTGKIDWKVPMRDAGRTGGSVTDPVVAAREGLVFTFSGDGSQGVDAYDADTGRLLWRKKGPHADFALMSGVLVVQLGELGPGPTATYAAFDPRSGKELWRRTFTSDNAGPLQAGADGTIVADLRREKQGVRTVARVDARTGRTVGRVDAPKGDLWLATVHGDHAYYARWENDSGVSSRIFVQDLTSGRVRSMDFPWAVEPEAPPLVVGETMYIFDYANEIVLALDLKRGKPLWTTSRELRVFSEPTVSGGLLYATTPDSSVVAIDTRTGRERWRTRPPVSPDGADAEDGKGGKGGTIDERTPSGTGPLRVGQVIYGVTGDGAFSVAVPGRSARPPA